VKTKERIGKRIPKEVSEKLKKVEEFDNEVIESALR